MDPDTLLTTTRAVRKRLDLTRPVSRTIVENCVRIGSHAPSAGNRQSARWILIDEPSLRRELADIYRQAQEEHRNEMRAGTAQYLSDEGAAPRDGFGRIVESVEYLSAHLHEVPVHVVPVVPGRVRGDSDVFHDASMWASIMPAAWSFMLALRARGLGSTWTTVHLRREAAVADLLGVPYDRYTQVGLFPVAYTIGDEFRPARRRSVADVVSWNAFCPIRLETTS